MGGPEDGSWYSSSPYHSKGAIMMKKVIAPVVIAGALLGGLAVAGAASASTSASTSTPASTVAATSSTTNQAGKPHLRAWLRAHRREIRRDGVAISAKTIGVTPQALVAELRTGKSVAEVAGEHNVSAQTVVNALENAADARINTAVTDHKLSQAQAQKIEAVLPKYLTKAVDR